MNFSTRKLQAIQSGVLQVEKSNSDIQFHRLLQAFDRCHIEDEDRERLLAMFYALEYEVLKTSFKSLKGNGVKRYGR